MIPFARLGLVIAISMVSADCGPPESGNASRGYVAPETRQQAGELGIRQSIARDMSAIHKKAASAADAKYPLPDVLTTRQEVYRAQLIRNHAYYDREFTRLAKPLVRKYGKSEGEMDAITEEVLTVPRTP